MKIPVLLGVLAALVGLRLVKANLLAWALAVWALLYVTVRFGFVVPIPASVVSIYMGIATLALFAYVTSDKGRWASFSNPLVRMMTERRYAPALVAVLLAIPSLVAAHVYLKASAPIEPPFFSRTVHPAPPAEITVHDVKIDLITAVNPYRALEKTNPEEFRAHLQAGHDVYFRNCVFCHGDDMAANGMFVQGLNPIPTNFTDKGTIAMLQESFLFWRISKGGPGLPEEGGPWDTAMPAWEKFLSEEQIWDVILFLYDFTDQRPRAREAAEGEK